MMFLQIQYEIFFYQPVNTGKPNFVSFLVFVGTAASFATKISSFESVTNWEAIWIRSQNIEYPKISPVMGTNQNMWKLLSTDVVITENS